MYSTLFTILLFLLTTAQLFAQDDLAQKTQNPISDLISLPFQNNTNFGIGPHNRTQNVLNIQPVIPFSISEDWNLVTRTIAPLISQPDFSDKSGSTFGLGDINSSLFLSPKDAGKIIWGIGPILSFPTATDDVLGTGKFGLGPTFVVLTISGPWVAGVLLNNIWSVAGKSDRADVNTMLIQYFINYNLAQGWYLVTAPIMTANWKADSGNQWTVPLGAGVGKIFKIGSQPLNASVHAYSNVVKPDFGADWTLRLQLQFLFPN